MSRAAWSARKGRTIQVRPSLRFAIYARDKFDCVWCRSVFPPLMDGAGLVLDHLLPRSQGGSDDPTNLVTACVSCNAARQDRSVAEYARECTRTLGCTGYCAPCVRQARNLAWHVRRAARRPLNRELGRWLARMAGRKL